MTRYAIVGLALLVLGVLVVGGWWQPHAPDQPERRPLLTQRPNTNLQLGAHRAASLYAPENTLPAIEAAIERGVAWVELDIRYTSDGVPVLLHDETVDRTTDATGLLASYSLAEVQQFDAGSWFSESYAGTPVPTLEQALQLMQGRVCAYWDAKALPSKHAVDLFQKYGYARGCLVIHVYEWFDLLHLFWPDAPLIRNARDPDQLAIMLSNQPWLAAIRVRPAHLNEVLVDKAHALGLSVFVRATKDGEDTLRVLDRVAASGADVITLDNLDVFRQWQAATSTAVDQPERL